MGRRLLEIGTMLAAVLSAGLVGLLLTAPLQPQPTGALPPLPSATPGPSMSVAPETGLPPIGLFLMRTAFSFGPCLAIELVPQSYPVADGAEGTATVHWWQRGMTGCDSRTGEVATVEGRTHVVPARDDPDGPPAGYTVEFSLAAFDTLGPVGGSIRASLTILAAQSTDTLLQAVEDAPSAGQGYVLDRVPGIDPPLDPLPSAAAGPGAAGPTGLYLLQGPLADGRRCLAIELAADAYPVDPSAQGSAAARWWEHGGTDPGDPAVCLSRIGEVEEVPVVVEAVLDPGGSAPSHRLAFALPGLDGAADEPFELLVPSSADGGERLRALAVIPDDAGELVFDRVDELDPPLVPGG